MHSKCEKTSGASLQSEGDDGYRKYCYGQKAEVTQQREGGFLLTLPRGEICCNVTLFPRAYVRSLQRLYLAPLLANPSERQTFMEPGLAAPCSPLETALSRTLSRFPGRAWLRWYWDISHGAEGFCINDASGRCSPAAEPGLKRRRSRRCAAVWTQPWALCSQCRGMKRRYHAIESLLPHHRGDQEVHLVLLSSLLGDRQKTKWEDATPGITTCLCQRPATIFAA
ncbi:uncharacterized protein LOC129213293 [Grus americana]|uniref:uncharacterized protein LOC129213293 n=1 Tax=Grus americana TaxID=9117 RepID=UPI002407C76B|nr:uncharacterized protein LOC129213293 [Grus americana]